MNTSSIVLLLCAFAVSIAHPDHGKHLEQMEDCISETGIAREVIESMKKGEDVGNDPKLKCFHACMLEKMGKMTSDGKIDREACQDIVPPDAPDRETTVATIDKCADESETGSDKCETGGIFFECLKKNKVFHPHSHHPH